MWAHWRAFAYIYIYAVVREFGPILPFQKGDLVPEMHADSPKSAFVPVLQGFRGHGLASADSDSAALLGS